MSNWIGFGITTTDARTGKRIAANVQIVDSTGAIYRYSTMNVPEDEGFAVIGCADGPSHVTIAAEGYVTIDNQDYVMPGPVNPNFAMIPTAAPLPEQPSRAERLNVRANFCNIYDSTGKAIFSAFLPVANVDDWLKCLVAAGSTHVVFSPECAYNDYMPPFDWRGEPDRFAALVKQVSETKGANGKALTPILFMDNGDPNPMPRLRQYWPNLAASIAKAGVMDRCIVVPAWEPVVGGYTSNEMSQALQMMHQLFAGAIMAWHGSPTRWVGSSWPVEPDDPWQGAESEFYKAHGGEFIDLVLYQAQADSIDAPNCDPAQEDCWLNRWADGVVRVGGGLNGWRVIPLCLAEGPAYSFIRGRSTPEQARAWAKAGGDYAKELGVTVSYMNGIPEGEW